MARGGWPAHGQDLGIVPSLRPYHPSPELPGLLFYLLWAALHIALECNLEHTDLSRFVSCWKTSMAPDRTVSVPYFL